MPRPRDSHEVGQRPELVDVFPRKDLREGVRSGDEEQIGIRALGAQVPQRVYGVRGTRPVTSTLLTANRGFDAVAITVMR